MSIRSLKNEKGFSDAYDAFFRYDETEKSFSMNDFSGGICAKSIAPRSNTVSHLMNMRADGKALFSLSLPRRENVTLCDGVFSDDVFADGIWLFRKGHSLYARKEDEIEIVVWEDTMEAENGAIFHVGDSFFVIDGERILRVERDLSFSVVEQKSVVWYINVSPDGLEYLENAAPNPFCHYLEYVLAQKNNDTWTIPPHLAVDPSYIEIRTNTGYLVPTSVYSFDGSVIKNRSSAYEFGGYTVRLKLADTSEDETKISFATLAADRELFAQAKDIQKTSLTSHEAVYLFREGNAKKNIAALLTKGTWDFDCLSRDLLVTKTFGEDITALVAYAEGYLIFSEGAVKKLFLHEDEDGYVSLTTAPFKNDFGSDMPGSVCGFDDKIIFANSRSGVYYINKFGISERDVSRHISANIEGGEAGFFSHTAEEYADATAACAFGRYYLTVGGTTYIWDYSAGLPSSTQSLADEYRMLWSVSNAWSSAKYLREMGKKLYYMDQNTQTLFYLTPDTAESDRISSAVTTSETNLDEIGKKRLTSLVIRYRALREVTLTLFYDGEQVPVSYVLPPSDHFDTVSLKPHGRKFFKCAVALFSDASMALESIHFRYIS